MSNMRKREWSSEEELPLYLDAKDIIDILILSSSFVYSLMRSGDLPSIKVGKRKLVQSHQFVEWMKRFEKGGESNGL